MQIHLIYSYYYIIIFRVCKLFLHKKDRFFSNLSNLIILLYSDLEIIRCDVQTITELIVDLLDHF